MGAELGHLSNHNLDLSSLVALAKDISNRFKVNVRYGFEESPFVNSELIYPNAEKRFDFYDDRANMVIGTVLHPEAKSTASLVEHDYLEKELCSKYGNTLPEWLHYDAKKFGPWPTSYLNESPWYYLDGDDVNVPSFNIEKGGLSLVIGDFGGWYQFNLAVVEPEFGAGIKDLTDYRTDIMRFTEMCGGTTAYHVMGSRGYEACDTWANTEKHIIERAGKDLMDIVEVIERCHHGQGKPDITDKERQKCYAPAFVDDFRDLKL